MPRTVLGTMHKTSSAFRGYIFLVVGEHCVTCREVRVVPGGGEMTMGCSPLTPCCTPSSYGFPILSKLKCFEIKNLTPQQGILSLALSIKLRIPCQSHTWENACWCNTHSWRLCKAVHLPEPLPPHTLCLIHHTPWDLQVSLLPTCMAMGVSSVPPVSPAPMSDCSPTGSSVHAGSQARIEWIAMPSSGIFPDRIELSSLLSFALSGMFFTPHVTWEDPVGNRTQ